jgi:aryl-alcohol dehydrogenase-like predicted oxidoreductase
MVSVVGLGGNNFGSRLDLEGTSAVVSAALDQGITLIDTADVYGGRGGSETYVGQALAGHRDEVIIATKFGGNMQGENGPDWGARGSRRYIRTAADASLRRLGTDYIDLYQYHTPDGVTPIGETLAALDELVKEGKIRYAGSSNLDAWQVVEAEWISRRDHLTRFISAQNEYSLLDREAERELVPACAVYGVGILPYFPLARGLLTGKYRRGEPQPEGTRLADRPELFTDEMFDVLERLEKYGAERGRTVLELAVAGLAAKPMVSSVIAGATSPEQVRANARAGSWEPSAQDMEELDRVLSGTTSVEG